MKMNYHKIPNVSKDVCTAEQMVAYNIAGYCSGVLAERYKNALSVSAICADEVLHDIIKMEFNAWKEHNYKKYNDDAIFCCLQAGLADFMLKPFIATDYKQVGEAFPAYYL